jgi:type II secretory pathway component PulF
MLEIGTTISRALGAIARQSRNPAFERVLSAMQGDIEDGRQLSDAMGRHPRVFNPLFVQMVRAGETGGYLKKILDRIVHMQEKRQALITQLRSTLTYPVVLLLLSVAVVVFVLVGILPKFLVVFEGNEGLLPLPTRILLFLSASIRDHWVAYCAGAAGLVLGVRMCAATPPGRALIDRVLVGAPVVGRLANKIYTGQLLRTLGHLMDSRIPMIQALEVTRPVFGNRHYRLFIDRIIDHVQQGGRFSQPFANYAQAAVKEMVITGDESGNLPKVMLRLAEFYDTEVEQHLKVLAATLEPVALMAMGAVIGTIVASVVLPMFRIASVLH